MAKVTKNLGIVKAIFVGTTAPQNTNVLWRDTSLAIPLHKYYNQSSSQWEELINAVLIDNLTIKKDIDGKLYADISEILNIPDGSITLLKLQDIPSGTLIYRRTAGDGVPEITTLAQLKTDLGLQGNNTGDQDLTLFALKSYTVNGKQLNGNITLTPTDIGSPTGSGNSTGTNTGDETESTILFKLGVNDVIELSQLTLILEDYVLKEVGKSLIDDIEISRIAGIKQNIYTITLPSSGTVQGRCDLAVEGVDYPTGWVISEGSSNIDFQIVHGLNRRIAGVAVFYQDGTIERQLFGNSAYSGLFSLNLNTVVVESLATRTSPIIIHLTFA